MKKLNKKYIVSLIVVLCLYVIGQRMGLISPETEQTAGNATSIESVQEEQAKESDSSATSLQESSAESTEPMQEPSASAEAEQEKTSEPDEASEEIIAADYEFRNKKLQDSHYEKHGIEMGFATVEDYVEAANMVIANPEALHKLEEEDNDHVYFIEETCEFVILSQDGYIRTYYIADGGLDYFNRQ